MANYTGNTVIQLNDCCPTADIFTGYLKSGKPYICCLGCNTVMLAPDLIKNDAETRFRAANVLINRWNTKNARHTETPVPFESAGWSPKPDRRRKKRTRQHEEQW
jgi:hypothetical protein